MRRSALVFVLATAALLLTGCEAVDGSGRWTVTAITGGDHVVEAAESAAGEVLVLGGRYRIAAGGEQAGSVHVLGGGVEVEGTVAGSVSALGGEVVVREGGVVTGELIDGGGGITLEPGSAAQEVVELDEAVAPAGERPLSRRVLEGLLALGVVAAAAAVAAAATPRLLARAETAARDHALVCGALGTLALLFLPALLLSMAMTLFLLPVALVLAFALGAVLLSAVVVLGGLAGAELARRRGRQVGVGERLLGALVVVLVLRLVVVLPLVGALVAALALAVGTGALLLTGFGVRSYHPPADVLDAPTPVDVR